MTKIRDSLLEEEIKKRKDDRGFLLACIIIAAILFLFSFLNTYVFFNVVVDGPSMQPTLYTDDILIATRTKELKAGDIAIIIPRKNGVIQKNDNGEEKWIIKRVIAVGKCTVVIENGYVYVDGEKLDEPYIKKQGVTATTCSKYNAEITERKEFNLTENQIFYLGDNREDSKDNRDYDICGSEQVLGVVRDWSINSSGTIKKIIAFLA